MSNTNSLFGNTSSKAGLSHWVLAAMFAGLSACGGGGSGGGATGGSGSSGSADSTAPTAQIQFPPMGAETEQSSITVRGTASDAGRVTVVRVNGVDASSTDDFATWSATVPLSPGLNVLVVETGDQALNSDTSAATVAIDRRATLFSPQEAVVDQANNRALVLDWAMRGIISIDLDSGARHVLSGPGVPNDDNPFNQPADIVVNAAGDRAFVTDNAENAVFEVDLTTGIRSRLSDNSMFGGATPIAGPVGITLDEASDALYVVNRDSVSSPSIISVSTVDGSRAVISNNSSHILQYSTPHDLVFDPAANRLFVTDPAPYTAALPYFPLVFDVGVLGGAPLIFSNSTTPNGNFPFAQPTSIAMGDSRLLVTDSTNNAVVSVDLGTGNRQILSRNAGPGTGIPFNFPSGIAIDNANNRAFVTDFSSNVLAVDLTDGSRSVFAENSMPDADHPFTGFHVGIVLHQAANRAYVLESDRILSVDLANGSRSVLSDNTTDPAAPISSPQAAALDRANNRLLVSQAGLDPWVIAVDLETGARTVLTRNSTVDSGDTFSQINKLVIDPANNRALVLDSILDAVITVNLNDGVRQNISPDTDNSLELPVAIDVNSSGTRAYVLDTVLQAVVEVDLVSGARTLISSNTTNPEILFDQANDIALDEINNRVLITDQRNSDGIIAIDLATGARTLIDSTAYKKDSDFLQGIELFDEGRQALVFNGGSLLGLINIDLSSGDRVIRSMN